MGTPYSEINDLFLTSIRDYKLDRMYQSTPSSLDEYLVPFLIKGIPDFSKCKKDLEDRDDSTKTFNITLNTDEKVILSNLMLKEWLRQEVNDVLQFSLHLQDKDFKTYSESNNLKEKQKLLIDTIELISKSITQYDYKNLDWSTL